VRRAIFLGFQNLIKPPLFALAFLVACSGPVSKSKTPPPTHSACSNVALQSSVWTPAITRDVLACLFAKSPSASLRLQESSPEQFKHLSQYLTQAFRSPTKRKELASLLARTRTASNVLAALLHEPLVNELGSRKSFVPALPWFSLSVSQIREVLVLRPSLLIEWLEDWNSIGAQGRLLAEIHSPLAVLLREISDGSKDPAQVLEDARKIFESLSDRNDELSALSRLSITQMCAGSGDTVVTLAPLAQTLEYFRQDRLDPERFANSVQQGFAYWSRVCRPTGKALEQRHVNSALKWIFDNWQPLGDFFAPDERLNWVKPGQELLLIAERHADLEGSNPFLRWLASPQITGLMVTVLQRDPQKLREWTKGFGDLAPLLTGIDDLPLSLQTTFLNRARQDLSWAPWLDEVSRMPAPVLQELWTLAQTLTPGGISDLATALDSTEAQDLLRFLEWILDARERPSSPEAPVRLTPPVAVETPPVARELDRARLIVSECLEQGRLDLAEICLEKKGLPTPPPFVRELWKLPSHSAALQSAQHPEVLELAAPVLASSLWQPLLRWIGDVALPVRPSIDAVAHVGDMLRRHSKHNWNRSFDRAWSRFRRTSATPLTPGGAGMRAYRTERASEIRSEFFADRELRDVMLSPVFFKRVLAWASSDKSSLPARRALLSLQSQRFSIGFWSADRHLERIDVTATEALDLLFWELQIPLISTPGMIRGVLESWQTLRTPIQVAQWLDAKDSQLGLGIALASLTSSPGEGLRRRLENARAIVRGLRRSTGLHTDLIRASAVLDLFKDAHGNFTNATVKSLMALHQFGFVHLISAIFDPRSPWAERLKSTEKLPISENLIESLALHLRRLIDRTPPSDLRALAAGQLREDLWILRGASATFMDLINSDTSLLSLLDIEREAFLAFLDETHARVVLPWLASQRGKSEALRDSELRRLKSLLISLQTPPKHAWILLATDLARSPELDTFWPLLSKLSPSDIDRLGHWMESGIPKRLLLWNRLLVVQNPDANAPELPR